MLIRRPLLYACLFCQQWSFLLFDNFGAYYDSFAFHLNNLEPVNVPLPRSSHEICFLFPLFTLPSLTIPLHSCSDRGDALAPLEHSWPNRRCVTLRLQRVSFSYAFIFPPLRWSPSIPPFTGICLEFFFGGVNLDVCGDSCCLTPPCGPFPLGGRHNDQWRRAVCLFFSRSGRNASGERPIPGPWALASAHGVSRDAVCFSKPLPNVKNSTICAGLAVFGGRTDGFHLSKGWNTASLNEDLLHKIYCNSGGPDQVMAFLPFVVYITRPSVIGYRHDLSSL